MVFPVLSSNSPTAGFIAWTAFSVRYGTGSFPVAAGNTNKKFAYFDFSVSTAATTLSATGDPLNGNGVLVFTDVLPGQDGLGTTVWDPNDNLVFLNRNGIGLYADKTSVIDGSLLVTGSILADAIGANQIIAGKVAADAIDSLQIKSNAITSVKIATGQINANHISAGSITSDKLTIGAFTANLAPNPYFEDWDAANTFPLSWTLLGGTSYSGQIATKETVTTLSGAISLGMTAVAGKQAGFYQTQAVPVVPGTDTYIGAYYQGTGGTLVGGIAAGLQYYNKSGVSIGVTQTNVDITGGNVVEQAQHVDIAPANAAYMQAIFVTSATSKVIFDNVEMGYRTSTVKIADGAISLVKMKANSVDTNQLVAGSVKTAKISSGQIIADHIVGGAISADKLTIGSFGDNLCPNPYFEEWDALNTFPIGWAPSTGTGWGQTVTKETVTILSGAVSLGITPTAGNKGSLNMIRAVPCVGGSDVYLSGYYAGLGSQLTAGVTVGINFYDVNNALITAVTATNDITGGGIIDYIQQAAIAPANAKSMAGFFTTIAQAKVVFDNVSMGFRTTGVQIAENTITAGKIKSGEIWAGYVTADSLVAGSATVVDLGATALKVTGPTGGNIKMDTTGITLNDSNNNPVVVLPTAISSTVPAVFKGAVEAASFSSTANGSLAGSTRLEPGSTTQLGWATQPPVLAPTYTIDWPAITFTGLSWTSWSVMGLKWDTANNRWIVLQWYMAGNGITYSLRALAYSATGVYQSTVSNTSTPNVGVKAAMESMAWFGGAIWYIIQGQTSTGALSTRTLASGAAGSIQYALPLNSMGSGDAYPFGLGVNSTNDRLLISAPSVALTGGVPSNTKIFDFNSAATAGANLITNTGLEVDTTNWAGLAPTTISRTTAAGTFRTGVAALQATAGSPQSVHTFTYGGTGLSGIPVIAGAMYDISFWMKASAANVFRNPEIVVTQYNSAGAVIGGSYSIYWGTKDTGTAFSQYQQTNFQLGQDLEAAFVQLKFNLYAGTTPAVTDAHYIDDFTVTSSAGNNVTAAISLPSMSDRTDYANAPAGIMRGAFDGGATRTALAPRRFATVAQGQLTKLFTSTGALSANEDFPTPTGAAIGGMDWNGTNFYSLSTTGVLYQHVNNIWTTESPVWWIANTYMDTTTGFLYETVLGKAATFTMSKRARLTVTSPDVPLGSGGNIDAKTAGFFLGRAATAPAYTGYFYQGNPAPVGTKSTLVITTPSWTGTADPVTGLLTAPNPASNPKAFPTGTAAQIISSDAFGTLIKLNGDGTGRVGPLTWTGTGTGTLLPDAGGLIKLNSDGSGRVGPMSWDNTGAYIPMVEVAPTVSPGSYPIGNSMFQTSAAGWPENFGTVVTDNINVNRARQTYSAKSGNQYVRSADAALTNGWTGWVMTGGDTGWLELAAATGYTKTTCQYRQVGKLVMIRYSFSNNAAISYATNGNITGDPAMSAALPAAFWPTAVHNYHGMNVNARLGLAFVGWTDGIIHISATDGTGTASTVPASSTIQGNTSWLLN